MLAHLLGFHSASISFFLADFLGQQHNTWEERGEDFSLLNWHEIGRPCLLMVFFHSFFWEGVIYAMKINLGSKWHLWIIKIRKILTKNEDKRLPETTL